MVSTEPNTFSSFLVPEYYFGRAVLIITFHSTGAGLYLETSKTDLRLWPLQMTIPLFLLLQTITGRAQKTWPEGEKTGNRYYFLQI